MKITVNSLVTVTLVAVACAFAARSGVPPLFIVIGLTMILIGAAGLFIWDRHHPIILRKPDVDNEASLVRNDEEVVVFVWTGLVLLITFFFQVWNS